MFPVAVGAVLALASWAVALALLIVVGLPWVFACGIRRMTAATVRNALWWGLLVVAIFVLAANTRWPLGSAAVAGLVAVLVVVSLVWLMVLRRGAVRHAVLNLRGASPSGAVKASLAAVVLVAVTLAVSAMGPLTNTDSGLYHLGAIRYSVDYAALTGLSNLYGPLGYGTLEFPLAALLSNGPWGDQGPRLLNGLILLMAFLDVLLRGRRSTAGFYVQWVGTVVLAVPMLAIADFWVISPTQDAAVFALSIVASGYLADALTDDRRVARNTGVLGTLAITLVLIRPTMIFFAVGLGAAVILRSVWLRRRSGPPFLGRTVGIVMALGAVAAAFSAMRDYRLSGWLFYPLSIVPFDVPWRAEDPTGLRIATLGYHRNPEDIWGSVEGWSWAGAWLGRLPTYWETWLLILLVLTAAGLALSAPRAVHRRTRLLIVCMVPSTVAVAAWFVVSPPSYRFAWGQVFTLGTIPVGWFLWRRAVAARQTRTGSATAILAGASLVLVLLSAVVLVGRTEWSTMTERHVWSLGILELPYQTTPLAQVPTGDVRLDSGLVLKVPLSGEQCWGVYPLCTPQPAPGLRYAGDGMESGFLP